MTKKKLPVRFTGQHFTIDKVLIKDAIRQANISNQDTVLDIGAGKGFLTVHLLKIANNVVAIENDTALVEISFQSGVKYSLWHYFRYFQNPDV